MIPNIGPLEIGIVLVVALALFGSKRLPEFGSSLGTGMRGFARGLKGEEDERSVLESKEAPPKSSR
jgi:sec-independent protein translocase protein TatA